MLVWIVHGIVGVALFVFDGKITPAPSGEQGEGDGGDSNKNKIRQ